MHTISEHGCFGGTVGFYSHLSEAVGLKMTFSVYRPPQAAKRRVPFLTFLSALLCNHQNFMIKSGAQRVAAELGLMLVIPDTSPRGAGIPGEDADWEFGASASFFVDATQEPWSRHYRMYTYVTQELPQLICAHFAADQRRQGIFGHSVGGNGALVCALRNPQQYRSVSAFAPVVAPSQVSSGQKAFLGYLGPDRSRWAEYDACELVRQRPYPGTILIDQGTADKALAGHLRPDLFEAACKEVRQPLSLRMQDGYDHGFYFISTFVEDHLRHHARELAHVAE
ncbi:S-formylglutathione hydrolase [Bradyrhizobium ontarionense]|uniref:S-formylglutathione hydrolase n=1 Tax=Bradyrhizobium ontarionense TaxID=2898149 RepID=A0ABY3RMP9_9BRAD|nr:S-formylglutathione hydrolase [Bradyrhizobium sp. A19]UFZ08554.1 S-formylglutathione hydrolase [Bradyrhizobium sp. A19]